MISPSPVHAAPFAGLALRSSCVELRHQSPAWRRIALATVSTAIALAFAPAHLAAQQPYGAPYGYSNPYAGQYAQPAPQYAQPQVQPPQYAQPQYGQPQYAQPQYAAPQQVPDQQQYANQPYSAPAYPSEQDLAPPQAAPVQAMNAGDLEQLLAPIALYPDALLAQILAASTYPAQVAAADQWMQQMRASGYGSPDQIAAGATQQTSWDPSVKALTAFPDVLDMLNHNLQWTTALGNAYYNQPQDVLQTVQMLRQNAEQAGNLQSTPQEDVTNNQGYIDIAPPDPQVVYVPTYNPWDVYGQPISPYPGFSLLGALGNFFGSSPIQYGLSFALGAFGHTPFGLLAWGLDWLANAVLFDHGDWFSHSNSVADWGLPHGGPRAYPGWHQPYRGPSNAYRAYGETQAYGQRNQWAGNTNRPGNYVRPAMPTREGAPAGQFNRGAESFNRSAQPSPNTYTRPANPQFAYSRPVSPMQQQFNRAAPQPAYSYRPQTYPNRAQSYAGRPPMQGFTTPGYGYAGRSTQSYAARPNSGSTGPYSSYRAPQSDAYRGYTGHSYQSYGNSFAHNESGGFHSFGGEKAPKYSAPKYSYKAPKSFGHERAPKMPKASHSSGGGGGHHHFL